jgi:hypothetical protein
LTRYSKRVSLEELWRLLVVVHLLYAVHEVHISDVNSFKTVDFTSLLEDWCTMHEHFEFHHGSPRAHRYVRSHHARRDIRILGCSRKLQPLIQMRDSAKKVQISPFIIVGCQPGLGLNEIVGCVGAPSSSEKHAMQFCHSWTMVHKRASSRTTGSVTLLIALRREGWELRDEDESLPDVQEVCESEAERC